MSAVRARLGGAAKVPGPDGIPGRTWALATRVLGDRLGRLFTACLKTGAFPSRWRRINLVLLHKDGKPPEQPTAYRPICLLDEAGKLYEVDRMANALCRLLPNLGGPGAKVRHLYTNTVRSVSFYGAPIWTNDLMANKRASALVQKADRRMAIRVARCYRTVLYVASTTLAGMPPFNLVAAVRAEVYRCAVKIGRSGISPETIPREVEKKKETETLIPNPRVPGPVRRVIHGTRIEE
nr:PREDICTED: uncharacterized protein LOC105667932 [Linepithema humile]